MKQAYSVQVGVVGGGLGGLTAACTLAARGYQVVLLERNVWLGGKAAILEEQGYRFDVGPTILTLPSVLRRIFAEAGQQLEDHLQLIRLDPQWRCFFDDGSQLDLHQDVAATASGIEDFSPETGAAEGFRRFHHTLAASIRDHGANSSCGGRLAHCETSWSGGNLFRLALLRALLEIQPGRSVATTVRTHVSDARVAQMLDHFTQYVGSAPDQSPAVLCGIAHMQTHEGVWYPRGGTGAVSRALESLARELGVEIRCGVGVRRILVDSGSRVGGLETDCGEEIPLAAVVANSDSVRTHQDLIAGAASRRFQNRRRYEPACSGVVLYLGLDRTYNHLAHHNFIFSENPQEEFDAIYRDGEPAADPTCYVAAPAHTEPEVAPPGGEALYVLVHTPYLRPHHDWKQLLPVYRRTILSKLATTGKLEGLEEHIRFERWLTPEDIQERFSVWNGAIYGLASHGKFLGAFKPSNRSPDVKGLYFAGGSVHPGPGMPMVIMSGWIAADVLERDNFVRREASRPLEFSARAGAAE